MSKDCGGPYRALTVKEPKCWENKPTTLEELAIIKFLQLNKSLVQHKSILHIGTGNGQLISELSPLASYIDSMTISLNEIKSFNGKYNLDNVSLYHINKYNCNEFKQLKINYDIIVDVNLKSFACCEKHFSEMYELFITLMNDQSLLITSMSGINFGWNGNTQISYTPGAQISVLNENFRILGEEGLNQLLIDHHLFCQKIMIDEVVHNHGNAHISESKAHIDSEEIVLISKNPF